MPPGRSLMRERLSSVTLRLRGLLRPPVTLGVRCIVIDNRERILLVRHTYMGGWHFPGGAVDPNESTRQAALREVREETGVDVGKVRFTGLYWNRSVAGRDHVALYLATERRAIDEASLKPQALEIAEVRLAPLADLPDGVTGATLRRLRELDRDEGPAEIW